MPKIHLTRAHEAWLYVALREALEPRGDELEPRCRFRQPGTSDKTILEALRGRFPDFDSNINHVQRYRLELFGELEEPEPTALPDVEALWGLLKEQTARIEALEAWAKARPVAAFGHGDSK